MDNNDVDISWHLTFVGQEALESILSTPTSSEDVNFLDRRKMVDIPGSCA